MRASQLSLSTVLRGLLVLPSALMLAGLASAQGSADPQDAGAIRDTGPQVGIRRGDKDGHTYDVEFFPGADHDPALTSPDELLGQPLGSRQARPAEIVDAFRLWDQQSARFSLREHGRTHEGRPLIHALIARPELLEREAEIRSSLARLFDPRGLGEAEAQALLADLPAIAFLGYSIHGDETSGSDAALGVAYHLAASRSQAVAALLDQTVVVLAPCMNPDGRQRIVSMAESFAGYRASLDGDSMARGRWPYGRGNHYLFDMNRDWMAGVTPETRARWELLGQWHPHLFVDAHEMAGYDTFLFYPQSAPRHPALPPRLLHWQGVLADVQGAAFDAFGWGYYTREWADAWYPGYSDSWGSLNGAIGMLYEQGSGGGQPLRRESGEVVPYREAVHGQVVASLASLRGLAQNREAILADWFAQRRAGLSLPEAERGRVLLIRPQHGGSRVQPLLELLFAQGIEVRRLTEQALLLKAAQPLPFSQASKLFPAGSFAVPLAQPQAALVRAYFDFDPRIDPETLLDERQRLLRAAGSRIYDVTAWDMVRQYGLDAAWGELSDPSWELVTDAGSAMDQAPSGLSQAFPGAPYAWAIEAEDDRSLVFVARALEAGLAVHVADQAFAPDTGADERPRFGRGSFLLRRHENPADVDALVERAARTSGARIVALRSGRAGDLETPDLGGQHFELLARPRVALLAGSSVSSEDFGHAWQYLDEQLRLPVTLMDVDAFGSFDLRRYNVLVVPPGSLGDFWSEQAEALGDWVRAGGTLIAMGSSAGSLVASELAPGDVQRRRDALDRVPALEAAAQRSFEAQWLSELDLELVWGDKIAKPEAKAEARVAADGRADRDLDEEAAERLDAERRTFMPQGAILCAVADQKAWLTAGKPEDQPLLAVPFSGSTVLIGDGEVPLRLLPPRNVRAAGLVWPEARERLGFGAWATRSPQGKGQILLFAASPVFRGSWKASARLLGNAVVLGPGLGATQATDW